jgi:hypothetical protein
MPRDGTTRLLQKFDDPFAPAPVSRVESGVATLIIGRANRHITVRDNYGRMARLAWRLPVRYSDAVHRATLGHPAPAKTDIVQHDSAGALSADRPRAAARNRWPAAPASRVDIGGVTR